MGLYCVLQQRSTPEVVFPLAEGHHQTHGITHLAAAAGAAREVLVVMGGRSGSGREEAEGREVVGGVSARVTTSRMPIFCPE